MRTEEEIRNRIEEIEKGIIDLVETGLYTTQVLEENRFWINALEWILEDKECQK